LSVRSWRSFPLGSRSAEYAADDHKFTTPSGKIEVHSAVLAARPDFYGLSVIPPIPTWFDRVEPRSKYPLMLCSPKSRARTHSIHGDQPQLARADPDDVWMHVENEGGTAPGSGFAGVIDRNHTSESDKSR
jgi:anaerobic selenocysteine-containing dehydrogenase